MRETSTAASAQDHAVISARPGGRTSCGARRALLAQLPPRSLTRVVVVAHLPDPIRVSPVHVAFLHRPPALLPGHFRELVPLPHHPLPPRPPPPSRPPLAPPPSRPP